jgi:curli biogenesis system outer membrane secretion channel CsgG
MKRILVAAVPFLAAAFLVAGPELAMASSGATCKQVQSELASGKTPVAVAKDLKISQKRVTNCTAHVASASKRMHGKQPSSPNPATAN